MATRSTGAARTCTAATPARFGSARTKSTAISRKGRSLRDVSRDAPFASFLVAGGANPTSRVEIVRADTQKVVYSTSGDDTENLKPVAVDLTPHVGQMIFIRLVDESAGGWGHINFDDFRLHDAKPAVPERGGLQPLDVYAHAGLDPREAAAAMTVPDGFRVTLFAGEPDVQQPIAQAIDDRGRLWVAEAYSYPHARAGGESQRSHPDLRGHRRRRPLRHAQSVHRQAEPGQRL